MTLLLPALAGAYLLAAVRTFLRERRGSRPFAGFQSSLPALRPARPRRLWMACLASAGLVLGTAQLGFPADILAGVLILAGLVLESWHSDIHMAAPHLLDFLASARKGAVDGMDFFELLTAAAPRLGKLPCRDAVEKTLSRHAAGAGLLESLSPLIGAGGIFRSLAADVAAAGSNNSPALSLLLEAALERAGRAWQRGSRMRAARIYLCGLSPWLRSAALGAAVAAAMLSLPDQPEGLFLAAALGILLLAIFQHPGKLFRLAAMACGLVVVIGVFSTVISEPVKASETALSRIPGRAPRGSSRNFVIRPSTEVNPDICRISTGVREGWASLRAAPAMEARVLAYLPESLVLTRTGAFISNWEMGAWRQVRTTEGIEGWIYAPLCPDTPAP